MPRRGWCRVIDELGGVLIVTADHGNADIMYTESGGVRSPKTSHTLSPVPFVIHDAQYRDEYQLVPPADAGLSNVAATLLNLLGFEATAATTNPACCASDDRCTVAPRWVASALVTYDFDRFLRYDELTAWLHDTAAAHPDADVGRVVRPLVRRPRPVAGHDHRSATGSHDTKPAHGSMPTSTRSS